MSDDLHAEIAQRLFGWEPLAGPDPWYRWTFPGGYAHQPPAFATDPSATALVWQWLETRGIGVNFLKFDYYPTPPLVRCEVEIYHGADFLLVYGGGATWPEALCRAALALAEELEGEQ